MEIEQRVKVVEVMALDMDPAVVVDVATPLAEVMGRMSAAKTGCSLVTRDGLLAGIITERDVTQKIYGHDGALKQPVSDWMTPDPERVQRTDSIRRAVRLMQRGGFRNVPVVDEEGRVVGCVRHKDFINYLGEHYAERVMNLPPEAGKTHTVREGA
jgi:CBS domain-containing protein